MAELDSFRLAWSAGVEAHNSCMLAVIVLNEIEYWKFVSEKKSFGYCNWITRLFRNWLQRTHTEEILLNSEWPRMIISCVRALKYSSELNLLSREVGGQRRQPLVCILKSNVRNRLWCLERLWDCQRSDLFTQNQSLNLTHATVAPVQSAAWMS